MTAMTNDRPLTARDEIRASAFGQLRCPSCGGLAGDILGTGHCLVTVAAGAPMECECRDGRRVTCNDLATTLAAANIALADDAWYHETLGLRALGFPV